MNGTSHHTQARMVRGDFHLHTSYSIDGTTTPRRMVERCQEVGFDVVAITDHDTIEGALRVQELAPFRVIVGEEVSSAEGHIIGLFLHKRVEPGLSVPQTIERIKDQGGIAIAPHPYSRIAGESLQGSFTKYAHLFDAVEIANSNNILRIDDTRAKRFAIERQIPMIGGSDAHHPIAVGSNVVTMPDFSTPEEFVRSLSGALIENRISPLRHFMRMGFWSLGQVIRIYPRDPQEALAWGWSNAIGDN